MNIKCVIFDLDGTLVDSEGLCSQAFLDLIPELECSLEDLTLRYRGQKLACIIQDIEESIGKSLPVEFETDYRSRVAELFDIKLKSMPGVCEMLQSLDYPVCVASSAPIEKIRKALSVCSLDSFFGNRIFSSYKIGSWKPEPDLFLHAAHSMGFLPEQCAVIEDSEVGIQAALAAGMYPLLYSPNNGVTAEPSVTVFRSMNELPSLVRHQTYKAFIFDLDGTLVDSEAIVDQVMKKWCHQNGIKFSDLEGSNHSSRTEDTVKAVAPHLDAQYEAEKIEALERDALQGLQLIRGASDFLAQLPPAQWGIATSSSLQTAQAKLNAVEIPIPNVLITADHVENGKPHPEAYLKALEELGIKPHQCLAFEDSETGAKSALDAGCHVLLIGARCRILNPKIIGRIDNFSQLDLLTLENSSMTIQINPKGEQGNGGPTP
ncbi:MAG: HAD-IA family hydrolase [Akkermansiaceae bacterium]